MDEDREQFLVNAVTTFEPFKHCEVTRIGICRLDTKSNKTLQRLEPRALKEGGIGIAEGRYLGHFGLVIGG